MDKDVPTGLGNITIWVCVVSLGVAIALTFWHSTWVMSFCLAMRQDRRDDALRYVQKMDSASVWSGRFFMFGVVNFGLNLLQHFR
jgi:hypothetical protein